ncbi:MAG: TlpA family protein disulfide reductase, partial [Planctomycetes bacterium]|nr:TlpA family protein disulfide reductase [Planctomycetota bacterium]
QKLADRHLRMASSTVHAINRLEDTEQREKYFQQFGDLFAKSDSKELARYGKKLAKKPAVEMTDLVGKPLALAGVTALGTEFDWDSYRGKVVLVDFWATWCGPCRAAMPHVKELYTELHEKGFDVVGVNLDKDQEQLAKYLDENEIAWANLIGDEAREVAKKYGVSAIPTMILVDRDGTVIAAGNKLDRLKPALDRLVTKADG